MKQGATSNGYLDQIDAGSTPPQETSAPTSTPLASPTSSPTALPNSSPTPALPPPTPTPTPVPSPIKCDDLPPKQFSNGFPKLQYNSQSLNRAIHCARPDLIITLLKSAKDLYEFSHLKDHVVAQRKLFFANPSLDGFHALATGSGSSSNGYVLSGGSPGDARIVLRLSAAAFFETSEIAVKYRSHVRELLLRWADSTVRADDPEADSSEYGLTIGSSMSAFAAGYDLLAAGGGIPEAEARTRVENWFRRAIPNLAKSNDSWYLSCRTGVPFAYDGQSCERARGDNHVSVGTAAVYALAVMTNDKAMQMKALGSGNPNEWGFRDRLVTVVYRSGDRVARPDRFGKVHSGEIYDRYRGHYFERTRGLQLQRSLSYPYLSLSALFHQALVARNQGHDLSLPVTRKDLQLVSLGNAARFYAELIKNYSPLEGFGGKPSEFFSTEDNYAKQVYCVDGFSSEKPTIPAGSDLKCPVEKTKPKVDPYYIVTMSAAKELYPSTVDRDLNAALDKLLSAENLSTVYNVPSGHVLPYEPTLLIGN